MKKVAIVTNFRGYDPAYGLCRYVRNEIKMLVRGGYKPLLLVHPKFNFQRFAWAYEGAEIAILDPGSNVGSNKVEITPQSGQEIDKLEQQLERYLDGYQVALTHDLIFQNNLWKHHVAARRVASKKSDLWWLHVVHSASSLSVRDKVGKFGKELQGKFPNSRLLIFDEESADRYGSLYRFELDEMVIVPPAVDFLEGCHPLTRKVVDKAKLMKADAIFVYPCRLDRGKQPEAVIEIASQLAGMGYDARVVLVNSYSNAGDKATYREELRAKAAELNVNLTLTSDFEEAKVRVPHQAVMELFEIGDILIQPSQTESYSRILVEAAWKRCGLVLNFDLPLFRRYQGRAIMARFSSTIDVTSGLPGGTKTEFGDKMTYYRQVAGSIAYQLENNPVLSLHREMRQKRSLERIWPKLWAAIEGCDAMAG